MDSTLVLAPPGLGKTTFLRDAIRLLSDRYHCRVALVDERGEVAAVRNGAAQLDVGRQTDIISGCPKSLAIPMLLRAMNPQIIAVDEVVERGEIRALERATHSGVVLLASVHGTTIEELHNKAMFSAILSSGVFRQAVIISKVDARRRYEVEAID